MPSQQRFPGHADVGPVPVRHVEHRPRELPRTESAGSATFGRPPTSKSQVPYARGSPWTVPYGWFDRSPFTSPPEGNRLCGSLWAAAKAGSTPGLRQHFRPLKGLPSFLTQSEFPSFQHAMIGTDPGRRHDVLPLDAVRALLVLPGPEVTRLAVDVSAGTALANVRAPAIEGLKVTDLLVDPASRFFAPANLSGDWARAGPAVRNSAAASKIVVLMSSPNVRAKQEVEPGESDSA